MECPDDEPALPQLRPKVHLRTDPVLLHAKVIAAIAIIGLEPRHSVKTRRGPSMRYAPHYSGLGTA